jgi:hypothetical protein
MGQGKLVLGGSGTCLIFVGVSVALLVWCDPDACWLDALWCQLDGPVGVLRELWAMGQGKLVLGG